MLIFFYLFAIASVLGALGVLFFTKPIYNAMSLVATFFCLGAIYVMLNAEFVAFIQILVYAGAIMVLFLFVLMLLSSTENEQYALQWNFPKILAAIITGLILAQFIGIFLSSSSRFGPKDIYSVEAIAAEGSIPLIGRLLFSEYILPFEIISILLLVAVIGAVVIGKRRVN